jgi:TatD DNase family protein
VESRRALLEAARRDRVVALGECGLDFDRNFSPPLQQEAAFRLQLALGTELGLPLFCHERAAHERFVALLREIPRDKRPPVCVHCFTGTRGELETYVAEGCFIGITGWIADVRRGGALREAVKALPLERLLLETDAPFLAPPLPPTLGLSPVRRNEPCLLPLVLQALADAMGLEPAVVAEAASRNTATFFRLPPLTSRPEERANEKEEKKAEPSS